MLPQSHTLAAGATEHVCPLDAYAPFGAELRVRVALMIGAQTVAETAVLCAVAPAILRFVRTVKRKKQVLGATLTVVGRGDDMAFTVEICHESEPGVYVRATEAVRGGVEDGRVLCDGGDEPYAIDFEFASNGTGRVELPREPGTLEWTACFGPGSLESEKLTIVVEEDDAPRAEATLWAFANRDATEMELSPEHGALRAALAVQLMGNDGEIFAGECAAETVWLKFAPRGAKGGRSPFVVELACDRSAPLRERRWLAAEDAVIDEDTAGAASEVGQKWSVSVTSEGEGKKLKTEKRTVEVAAGAPHHLEIEWKNTPVGERLARGVGPLALDVTVVDRRGYAVAASALGRWHLTVVAEECDDDETQVRRSFLLFVCIFCVLTSFFHFFCLLLFFVCSLLLFSLPTQPPTMSVARPEYTLTPARGGSTAEQRAAGLIKQITLADGDEALLFENDSSEGTWSLPPLLLDVGAGVGGSGAAAAASEAAYASESNRVRVTVATRGAAAPQRKKKKRARRSAAAEANDAISLTGSIALTLAPSDRIVGLESVEVGPILAERTVADGFPTFEYLLKTDGDSDVADVAIDLAKVKWSVAPTLPDGDELFDVASAEDGGPGFRLVPKRDAPRAPPGQYRVVASYTEDRYAVVAPYAVDVARTVRLRAGAPVALVRSSAGRAALDASNVDGRRSVLHCLLAQSSFLLFAHVFFISFLCPPEGQSSRTSSCCSSTTRTGTYVRRPSPPRGGHSTCRSLCANAAGGCAARRPRWRRSSRRSWSRRGG